MKRAFLSLLLTVFFTASLLAQEVAAGLSSNQAQVGEPIQLMVTVRGARGAEVPQTLDVKGLRINLTGRSTQFEMRNFKMTSTLTYTYLVVPQFEGEFTIPTFDVQIEGKTFRTQAMRLVVSGAAQAPSMPSMPGLPQNSLPSGQPQPPVNEGDPFFAELILSKRKVFVGEVVPVEFRFYFNSRIGGQVGERPNFGGEGFTVQKFSNAVKREQVVNGTNYVVFSFQSAITAVKTGTLQIPEASLEARLQVPGRAPQGFEDFFNNLPIPQGMFTDTREVTLKTKPVQLEVQPLPKDGRPEDFSGAVGKFTMEATVSPKKAAGGEPVTLKVAVSGQGNFEGMGAPVLTGDEGWRSYPPSDKFQSTDSVGFTGEKTFEFPLIARQDQNRTPGVRFSYFDPSTEKFVTLSQEPLPVDAKAGGAPAAAAGTPAGQGSAASTPVPAAPVSTPDITAMAGGSESWTALFFRKEFLVANLVLGVAWLALVLILALRKFTRSSAGLRLARKKHLKEAFSSLSHAEAADFYKKAKDYISLCFNAGGDDLALAPLIESSSLPVELKSSLYQVLDRHDALKYAAGGAVPPSLEERQSVIALLKDLETHHEK
ncbi:MAG: BatD family protein [Terrimicrobiaceae bacterium]